jgi:hypothetical protein
MFLVLQLRGAASDLRHWRETFTKSESSRVQYDVLRWKSTEFSEENIISYSPIENKKQSKVPAWKHVVDREID